MKGKWWIIGFLILIAVPLGMAAYKTYHVDPYFHYHKPYTDEYYYNIYNQRSQNDGIARNFEYDGLLTGTSMTENFRASEAERLFGGNFIRVSFSGGTFKEFNNILTTAFAHNDNLKNIIFSLDKEKMILDKDAMRTDLGKFPTYLYNDNPFDDVEYLFNRDVLFSTIYDMEIAKKEGAEPGISTFNTSYIGWDAFTFGVKALYPGGVKATNRAAEQPGLTESERAMVTENVRVNILELAKKHPDATFYLFIPPYGAMWWQEQINGGEFNRQLEAEQIVIEELLKADNIRVHSFNLTMTDIITDLNHYKDNIHYGEWINSLILHYMSEGKGLLTKENYEQYLAEERDFYWNFNYEEVLGGQKDYERDLLAAMDVVEEIAFTEPYRPDRQTLEAGLMNAEIVEDQYEGTLGVLCKGHLNRETGSKVYVADYIRANNDYNGVRIVIDDISDYRYLVVYGKKVAAHGQPGIYVYDSTGALAKNTTASYGRLDAEWHPYIVDVTLLTGRAEIVLQGGYIDASGSPDSRFIFSDIVLY